MTKLRVKDYLILGSLFFGMLFGAGNLIFPVHLGQLAGHHWLPAAGGFLLSGGLLPLLALLALALTRSTGIDGLAKPLGKWPALIFLIVVQVTIGPLFATPRTATVSYAVGIAPHIPTHSQSLVLFIYTALFFGLSYLAMVNESKITDLIGKYLNPLFLILLAIIFILAFIHPMGAAKTASVTSAYKSQAFPNGFLEGYNTMDGLGASIFGVAIITALREMGIKERKIEAFATIRSGLIGMSGIALIYVGLIWLGATSRHHFNLAANGGTTLAQVAHFYLGTAGDILLALLTILACITTGMGLVSAFSQDFHRLFPKVSYKNFLRLSCGISFLIANLGLDSIIKWSLPILVFLYPLMIALILLGILSPLFKRQVLLYRLTICLTLIPAYFDLVKALPPVLSQTGGAQELINFANHYLPLYPIGFAWLPFTLTGLILSWLIVKLPISK